MAPNLNLPEMAASTPAASNTNALPNAGSSAAKSAKATGCIGTKDDVSISETEDSEAMDFESALEAAVAISSAPANTPAAPPAQNFSESEGDVAATEAIEGAIPSLAKDAGRSALSEAERAWATVAPAQAEAFNITMDAAEAYQAMETSADQLGLQDLPEGLKPVDPHSITVDRPAPTQLEAAPRLATTEATGIASIRVQDLAPEPVPAETTFQVTSDVKTAAKVIKTPPANNVTSPEIPTPEITSQAVVIAQTNESTKQSASADSESIPASSNAAPVAGDASSVVRPSEISKQYGVKNIDPSHEKDPESLRAAAEKNVEGSRTHAKSTPLSSERGAEGIAPRQALPEEKDAARDIPAYPGAMTQPEKNLSGVDGKISVSPTAPRTQVEQVQQIAQSARECLANGKRVMEIELKPEGMGSVTLRITGNPNSTNPANELRLDISVSSQEAHTLLSRHLDDLKSVLGKWDINLSPMSQQQVRGAQEGSNGSAPDGRNPQQDGQRRPQYQQWFERSEAGAEAFSEHFDSAVGN